MSLTRFLFLTITHFCVRTLAQSPVTETTNTCLRRSVVVYTSGQETYVVTDFGNTSFNTPSVCPNVTAVPSTVYASASTVTIFQPSSGLPFAPTSCPAISALPPVTSVVTVYSQSPQPSQMQETSGAAPNPTPVIVTDNGFENGDTSALNGTATDAGVYAVVVEGDTGPLAPYEGNSFL